MFERHFGLRENPFHSGHQLRFLYPSREHQEARAHLRFGIENREPFVLITGEVGTGKTTALYDALAEWGSKVAVALITNSALSRQELIEEIGLRFGLMVPAGASKPHALAMLERHLNAVRARGEHAVLLLDEAQNLKPELLEEIRLLSNLEAEGEKLVQIFLVGQPELEALLAQPQLRQLRQRISVHYRLNPLSPEETTAYIHHRVAVAGGNPFSAFPPETCREIYRVTHGIPREINTVASQAMIAAFSESAATVQPNHVHEITTESEFQSVLGVPRGDVPDSPAAAVLREAETPAHASAPARETATPAPEAPSQSASASSQSVEPPAPAVEPTHAWTPPELGVTASVPPPPPLAVPPASSPRPSEPEPEEVLDAWSVAAKELMEARRRATAADRIEIVANDPHAEPRRAAAATPPRFPSLAELAERAEAAQPHAADLSGLPERLRAKISAEIAAEERREAGWRALTPVLLGAVAVLALVLAAVLLQRFQVIDVPMLRGIAGVAAADTSLRASAPAHAPEAAGAGAVASQPAAASTPSKPGPDTFAGAPSATPEPERAVTKPVPPAATLAAANRPATATPPAGTASAASTKEPAPAVARADSAVYGLGVAAYLDRDRAEEVRGQLASRSGLPTIVVPYDDAGTTMFRVVLGRFGSNAAAESAALELMTRLGVTQATPLKLARASSR